MSQPQSPYVDIERSRWAPLATWETRPLSPGEIRVLSGVIETLTLEEIEQIYLPLAHLVLLRVQAASALADAQADFLGQERTRVPFLIGLAGSVAVGKSTTARALQALLTRMNPGWDVARVTTDGFLYPNAVLDDRGLLRRKGFPESYDQRGLLTFVADLKSGVTEVPCPVYSHQAYDITGEQQVLRQPDVAIIEGLNVLQTGTHGAFVSDYFDFTVYVDAATEDLRHWYLTRFERLRRTAFQDPEAYFHRYATLDAQEARQVADRFWHEINLVNLQENIVHTRERADLILQKGRDHRIARVRLRKS